MLPISVLVAPSNYQSQLTLLPVTHGSSSKDWIHTEFPKVKKYVTTHTSENMNEINATSYEEELNSTTIDVNLRNEMKSENTVPEIKESQETGTNKKSTSIKDAENESNIENLWEECTTIKNSIKTVQSEVMSLSKENDAIKLIVKKQKDEFTSEILSLKIAYDNKLTVFMSAISIDCTDKIKTSMSIINKDLLDQKKNSNRLESRVDTFAKRVDIITTKLESENDTTTPNWEDLQKLTSTIEKLEKQTNLFETKIESLVSASPEQPTTDTDNNIQFLQHNITLLKTEMNTTTHKLNNKIETQLKYD